MLKINNTNLATLAIWLEEPPDSILELLPVDPINL